MVDLFVDLMLEEREVLARCRTLDKLRTSSQQQINFFNVMVKTGEFSFPVDLLLRWGHIPDGCQESITLMIQKLLLNAETTDSEEAKTFCIALLMICSNYSSLKIVRDLFENHFGNGNIWSFLEENSIYNFPLFVRLLSCVLSNDLACSGIRIILQPL